MKVKEKRFESKKKSHKNNDDVNWNQGITEHNVADLCQDYMKIFAANNNYMRHLPGLYDGLKPVQRRTLYSMYEAGINYDKDTLKVGAIMGLVTKYHPHSDTPVYGTIVAMGQKWSNLQCLIDGQGNFGSVKGEPPAASR